MTLVADRHHDVMTSKGKGFLHKTSLSVEFSSVTKGHFSSGCGRSFSSSCAGSWRCSCKWISKIESSNHSPHVLHFCLAIQVIPNPAGLQELFTLRLQNHSSFNTRGS